MTAPLHTAAFISANLYKDSVALMRVAQGLLALPGVVNATLQMGNPANKDILREAGLLHKAVQEAGPSDVMVVVQARSAAECAAAEALKAVKLGMHVFLFSDNVPLAQEAALKQEATRRGLLVMGPDCGTAIISGVPLGFANAVRRGNIGLVAASGTGLQEVSTQIHRMGGGVSHALGTGGARSI